MVFLCCGDALFDLFTEPAATIGNISLIGHVGGSPLNVATGLARLGNDTGYLCKNSTDIFGQRIQQFLAHNKVSLEWLIPTDQNSTLAVVETDDSGSANYVFYTDNTADVSLNIHEVPATLPSNIQVLHVGSYSTGVNPTASSLVALVQREQSSRMISYDPNIRPTIEPDIDIWREQFNALASCSDLVKASDEDIAILFGADFSHDNFASDTLALGAGLVIVTAGANGATIYADNLEQASATGIKVDVVDTVGAGDTFQSSTLHWLKAQQIIDQGTLKVAELDLTELLNFALTAAAITCTRRGADLPTLTDIERFRHI